MTTFPNPEIDKMKSDLRACKTVHDAHRCYDYHHSRMAQLYRDRECRPLLIQVANLRDYQIAGIQKGLIT